MSHYQEYGSNTQDKVTKAPWARAGVGGGTLRRQGCDMKSLSQPLPSQSFPRKSPLSLLS